MSLQPRPEIENLKACPHGGLNRAELAATGLTPGEVTDFSVSSNPFILPSRVKKAFNTIPIECYPDSEATELRQCLSEKLGLAPENILAGNGAVELIRLIALAYFGHGDYVLIPEPTFGECEVACQIVGAGVYKQRTAARDNFALRVEETASLIKQRCPRGVFICNPNNPTGQYLSRHEVEMILDAGMDSLLILDEAYLAFVDEAWSATDLISRGNVVIVRSMTKDYALAGLRLGYAVASRGIIDNLRRVRSPWNVNVIAQKAGVVVLNDTVYLERCQQKIRQAKQFLIDKLRRMGFTLVPSRANFFLVKVGDARAFRTALLKRGILVRDCASFGLPEYIRIAPRTMPECKRLINTIKSLKNEGGLSVSVE